jgi:hypothetical protein
LALCLVITTVLAFGLATGSGKYAGVPVILGTDPSFNDDDCECYNSQSFRCPLVE